MGVHTVRALLKNGHSVAIATRGLKPDNFGDKVTRIAVDHTNAQSLKDVLANQYFDVVCDSLAYCSNDIKYILDAVHCRRYITTSSTAIYKKHTNTTENEFDPLRYPLKWCGRADYPYDEIKRQAECALFQAYPAQNAAAVRFPFVIGKDDYTKRLYFYVEHTVKGIPMFVDNLQNQMGFIQSKEAGQFIAWLAEQKYIGAVNGSSSGTISIAQILDYVEKKANCKAILCSDGDSAPYNGEPEYSINTDLAKKLGFTFTPLQNWIYSLLDEYIQMAKK